MKNIPATQIIILGGTGDLSQRKLLPALYNLYKKGKLPEKFNIVGLARKQQTNDEYRTLTHTAIIKSNLNQTIEGCEPFCQHISYLSGSFDDSTSYQNLKTILDDFDNRNGVNSNKIFYLAVPPELYQQIFTELKLSNLVENSNSYILVEKPFGKDLETAQTLDAQLASLYQEEQIFRIDHYLAKEAVQNILSFRFANRLLQSSWTNEDIASVHITMTETIDVGHRKGFYEGVGALRDVGQNHLLQLLALVAMREPENLEVESIRQARCAVLQSLKPIELEKMSEQVLRAQYEDYSNVNNPEDDSKTETYFELKAELNMPEWKGVPFYIRAGKALDMDEVSITIKFKDINTGPFKSESCLSTGNQIVLNISPEQKMSVMLNAKLPGLGLQLEQRTLSFTCEEGDLEIKNSYERVLYDSIIGDKTLFTRTEEVLASWEFITPILNHWNELPLHYYKKGSKGPVAKIITDNN